MYFTVEIIIDVPTIITYENLTDSQIVNVEQIEQKMAVFKVLCEVVFEFLNFYHNHVRFKFV